MIETIKDCIVGMRGNKEGVALSLSHMLIQSGG